MKKFVEKLLKETKMAFMNEFLIKFLENYGENTIYMIFSKKYLKRFLNELSKKSLKASGRIYFIFHRSFSVEFFLFLV